MRKIIFGLITLAIAAMAGDVEDGLKAYENRDYFKAKKYFQKACDGGDAFGCGPLGDLYKLGQGVKQDYFKAKEYYQKSCDGGNAGGCGALGVLYELGQGVKQNKLKAKELYGRACDMGVQLGCEDYARLNSAGY
ncbi:tetratricopeptide repeat protein [Campylobacter hyointestinalis]|uniref:tetratricopeptide repeat protein n=1 Tax=Campylobacter hyointestinalis TaxID=198 RepID=UPI000CE552EC|nr:tetratricopeptide repeat protein [Campylobacter hyointestinalis]PPB68315.1 Sel1 repeat protein HcpC [Campylobacter hyointestinalis subsp. hyointestinalis]TWO22235.1 sel1 repeat family protein [Campylobacter hyointestinalis]